MVDALQNLTDFLKGVESASESTYVQQIANAFDDVNDQRSFALRLVIHYVGDVHQPLHAVSEVDHYYPKGDAGGNFEHVPEVDDTGVTNLHSIWDSVIYEFPGYPSLPLNDDDWDSLTSTAQGFYEKYPIDQSQLNDGDFDGWAAEGLDIAKNYVYKDFDWTHTQSDEYLDRAKSVLEPRLVYASERLYQTIVDIYGSESTMQMLVLDTVEELFLQ